MCCQITIIISNGLSEITCRVDILLKCLPLLLRTLYDRSSFNLKLDLWKSIKLLPPELFLLAQIGIKSFVGWGFAPDQTGGAYSAPPDPLAGLMGPTSKKGKGRGERRGGEGPPDFKTWLGQCCYYIQGWLAAHSCRSTIYKWSAETQRIQWNEDVAAGTAAQRASNIEHLERTVITALCAAKLISPFSTCYVLCCCCRMLGATCCQPVDGRLLCFM